MTSQRELLVSGYCTQYKQDCRFAAANELNHCLILLCASRFPSLLSPSPLLPPAVYVFDFQQEFQGVVRLRLPSPLAGGLNITLRHAELLRHPPYGPVDGNIYVSRGRG